MPPVRLDPDVLLGHSQSLRRLARALTRGDAEADDVVQEAYTAAVLAARRPPRDLGAWLRGTVRRAAAKLARGEGRRRRREAAAARAVPVDSVPAAAEAVERLDVQRAVLDAVRRLPEPYRYVVLLRYIEDLTPTQIAERQGVPLATAKSWLRRGLERLRADLDARWGADGDAWRAALLPLGQVAFPTGTAVVLGGLAVKKVMIAVAVLLVSALAVHRIVLDSSTPPGSAPSAAQGPAPEAIPAAREAPLLGGHSGPTKPAVPTPEAKPPDPSSATWLAKGRVLDEAGRGVPGATVTATFDRANEVSLLPTAISTADGGWAIDLEDARRLGALALQGTVLRLVAWAHGHAPSEAVSFSKWPAAVEIGHVVEQDLVLRAGDVVHGRVVRGDGTPVASADIVCCDAQGTRGEQAARSLPDGRFAIMRPSGPGWSVAAWSEAAGAGRAPIDPSPDVRDIGDVVLHATPAVDGQVVYADGSGVGEAWLWAEVTGPTASGSADPWIGGWGQGHVRTRADGTFRVFLPREGECRLWLDRSGAEAHCRTGDRAVRLVVTARRLRVRIVDAEGRDVPGLGYLAVSWAPEHAARLDDLLAGRIDPDAARRGADYTSAGSPAEAMIDFFAEPGSAWLFMVDAQGVLPGEATLRVPAEGNESEVRLVLRPSGGGGRLHLHVIDEKGAAVTLVHVTVSTPLGSGVWGGVLPLDGVVGPFPTGPVRLSLRPVRDRADDGWVPPLDSWLLPATARAEVAEGAPAAVTVRLLAGGRLRLLLRSPRDAPEGTIPRDGYGLRAVPLGGGGTVFLMTHDGDGQVISSNCPADRPSLTAEVLSPGDYRVEVSASGKGWTDLAASGDVRVRAGEVMDLTLDLKAVK